MHYLAKGYDPIMKKLVALILALALVLVCTACSKKEPAKTEAMMTYTVYNRTGEAVTELTLTDDRTGKTFTGGPVEDGASVEMSINAVIESDAPDLSLSFTVAGGSTCQTKVIQKDCPITLLPVIGEEAAVSFEKPEE